jgi:Tol biopolymer transport system component
LTRDPTGTIAFFVREPKKSSGLYSVDVATGIRTRLTGSDAPAGFADWSPDGSSLAFGGDHGFTFFPLLGGGGIRFVPPGTALWEVAADGSGLRQLLPERWSVADPAWSSNYDLAFVSRSGTAEGAIYVLRSSAFGRAPQRVFDGGPGTGHVAWSPDGDEIVFTEGGKLHVVDVTTGDAEALPLDGGGYQVQPDWSPDGTTIVYTQIEGDRADLYAYRLATGETVRLTDMAGREEAPTWSPDGDWIAFMSNAGFQDDIMVMRPDGSDIRRITNTKMKEVIPTWRAT